MKKISVILLIGFIFLNIFNSMIKYENYAEIEKEIGKNEDAVKKIIFYVIILTIALLIIKKIFKNLCILIDIVIISLGFMIGSLFNMPLLFALLFISGSKAFDFERNIIYILSLAYIAVLLSKILQDYYFFIFMSSLVLYDVLGIFYLKYIKTIWLESRNKKKEICGIVFHTDLGTIGSGDILLVLLSAMMMKHRFLFIFPGLFAMYLNSLSAKKFKVFPGTVYTAIFAFIFKVFPG